jgi:hypothetical protein
VLRKPLTYGPKPSSTPSPQAAEEKRKATSLPALDLAIPHPRELRALWWMGDQQIWRPAMFSPSLGIGLVASSSGVRRRAPVWSTAPPNKISPDPAVVWLSLVPPVADLERVWSGLAGKSMVSSRPGPYVLRVRRRRGRDLLRLCSWIRGLLQELRRRRWFSTVGAREQWCLGARLVVRGGGSGLASSTTSVGAPVSGPRKHGIFPGRRSTATAPRRSRWGSSSTLKAVLGDGAFSVFWEDGASCQSPASWRRWLVLGLDSFVLGHFVSLEFFRDFCICTPCVLVLC